MFESYSKTRKRSGSVAKGLKHTCITLSNNSDRKAKKVTIHIPPKVAEASGLHEGDRMDVLFNREDRQIRFQKTLSAGEGWKLGKHLTSENLRIQVTLFDGFVTPVDGVKAVYLKSPFIKKGQVTYDMPDDLDFFEE